MSKEKKLHSRLEGLMSGLGGVAHNGQPLPAPAEPAPPAAAAPGAPIDAHGVVPGWTWETDARGFYTACSGEISALLGFDPAALVGQPLTHIAGVSWPAPCRPSARCWTCASKRAHPTAKIVWSFSTPCPCLTMPINFTAIAAWRM